MRRLLISIAAICVLALAAFALASRPPQAPGDDIIIKGGSMTIECGFNHNKDCLTHTNGTYLYTHRKNAHIMHVQVLDNANTSLLDQNFDAGHQPTIKVTYK